MENYGKTIYCTRGETFALDCLINNRDKTPYRISTALPNAFLLLTITSDAHCQENEYVLRTWIDISNYPKVSDMTILDVDKLPEGENLVTNRLLHLSTDDCYYIYDYSEAKYVKYQFRLINTFHHSLTKLWIERSYNYTLKLVSGVVKDVYENDDAPFESIEHVFDIINDGKIYVTDGGTCCE